MPPPPAIGSARSLTGTPENAPGAAAGHPAGAPGNGASAGGGAAAGTERASEAGGASEGSTTAQPGAGEASRADEGPSDGVGSRSLPIDAARLRVPTPMPASSTVPRVPEIDGEASGTLKVPVVGAAGDSAGSWPRTDGWDLDDDDGSPGAGGGSASVPSVPKPAASSVPSIPKLGSIPSVPKPAPSVPKAGAAVAKAGASKEVGSVPTVPKTGASTDVGSVPTVPKTSAAKEVGSVPSVPKLGSVPKVGPLPKPGARPTPAPRRAAAEEADARPLFGSALAADGSLLSGSAGGASASASAEPPLDALAALDLPPLDSAIDASAPPSSASPLDALPSFDPVPSEPGAPQDGFPSMDSSALLGVALEPVVPFDPGPPRLPVPGMLRDGAALSAADFRGPARTPNVQPAAAMPPPRGMVPPKPRDEDEVPRLRPGDTQSFVAQVAEELMEEVDRQRAEKAAAAAAALAAEASPEPEPVAARPVAAAAFVPPASDPRPPLNLFPLTPTPAPSRAAEARRRGKILGLSVIGLVAAIGLFVWLSGDDEPPTQTAAVTSPPRTDAEAKTPVAAADAKDDGDAKADSPAPLPPADAAEEPAPAAEGEAVAAEAGAAEAGVAEGAGEPAEPVEAEGDAGADGAAAEAQPVDDGAGSAGSSPRKSSGRSSKPSGKSGGSSPPKEEPAPAPKTDDAPSAAKLLKQARSAYNAGKGSTAYSLASKSNRMEPSGEAAEVMALAACQMGDADKAKAALRTVPLFSRSSVRSTCKSKHNVKLGL